MKFLKKRAVTASFVMLTSLAASAAFSQTYHYSIDYVVPKAEPNSERSAIHDQIRALPNYVPQGQVPSSGSVIIVEGPFRIQGNLQFASSPSGTFYYFGVINDQGIGATFRERRWVSPDYSILVRDETVPAILPGDAREGRYMLPSDQFLLTGVADEFTDVEPTVDPTTVRFRRPILGSDSASSGVQGFDVWTVRYQDSSQDKIVSASAQRVFGEATFPLKEYDVEGSFGEPGYRVRITTLANNGAELSSHWLTFMHKTDDLWDPAVDIPLGSPVVDLRSGNPGGVPVGQWAGAPLPLVAERSAVPAYAWFATASLLCLVAGMFFWRKR
ncbi:MAG: hypothetical protein ACK4P3_01465 [Fimbriimonadaceae bacterium]